MNAYDHANFAGVTLVSTYDRDGWNERMNERTNERTNKATPPALEVITGMVGDYRDESGHFCSPKPCRRFRLRGICCIWWLSASKMFTMPFCVRLSIFVRAHPVSSISASRESCLVERRLDNRYSGWFGMIARWSAIAYRQRRRDIAI